MDHDRLIGIDLFSGIGGITDAIGEWVRPVAYCENNRFAQSVLLSRMAKGQLPVAPIWNDVTTLRAEYLPPGIDIIYGGFPCQDISQAGDRVGIEGKRSSLVKEIWRLADEIRPSFIFLENVPALITNGLDAILAALAERRFDARWLCLSASDVGACHIRNRWWLLAYANNGTPQQLLSQAAVPWSILQAESSDNGGEGSAAHTNDQGQLQSGWLEPAVGGWSGNSAEYAAGAGLPLGVSIASGALERAEQPERSVGWPTVAPLCRADDGIPARLHRVAALGNAVVPQCAREAFKILMTG